MNKCFLIKNFAVSVFNNGGLLVRNVQFHYTSNNLVEIRKTGFRNCRFLETVCIAS